MKPTLEQITEVQDMVKTVAATQRKEFGEAAPFFAAVGDTMPTRMEKAAKEGGLPWNMQPLGETKEGAPVLVNFYLGGVPKSLWRGLMEATASDINATCVVFCAESWALTTVIENKEEVEEYLEKHGSLEEHPDRTEIILVTTNYRDGAIEEHQASINSETNVASEYKQMKGSVSRGGVLANLKW